VARDPDRGGAAGGGRRSVCRNRGGAGHLLRHGAAADRRPPGGVGFFETDEDTYATALTFVAERFQRLLEDRDSYGVVVLDSRKREVDDRMRRFFERIQREGTAYRELNRIIDSLLLGPSHYSLGLQVADLVVATTLKAQRAPGDATRWLRQLEPRFARHPVSGEIDGVGLKIYPPPAKGEEEAPRKLF
jgi:hypothetical protein